MASNGRTLNSASIHSCAVEMAAYDALPAPVRAVLRDCSTNCNAVGIWQQLRTMDRFNDYAVAELVASEDESTCRAEADRLWEFHHTVPFTHPRRY